MDMINITNGFKVDIQETATTVTLTVQAVVGECVRGTRTYHLVKREDQRAEEVCRSVCPEVFTDEGLV